MSLLRVTAFVFALLFLQITLFANSFEYLKRSSQKSGPTIAVIGYQSEAGNAGVHALSQIATWEISRGTLVVFRESDSSELIHKKQIARLGNRSQWTESVNKILEEVKPDWVIQLSESFDAKSLISESHGSTIYGQGNVANLPKLVSEMSRAAEVAGLKDEPKWKHHILEMKDVELPQMISVVTSAKHPQKRRLWVRSRQQRAAVHELLSRLEMRAEGSSYDDIMPNHREQGKIRLAIYHGPGAVSSSGHDPVWIQHTLRFVPGFQTSLIGPVEIQAGKLSQFDVLLVGGGLSNRQSKGLGRRGRDSIKKFVKAGGGYVGICAGMFLACSSSDYRLGLLPIDSASCSGIGKIKLDFDADREIQIKGTYPAKFSGGPVKVRKLDPSEKNVKILAYFRSEPLEKTTSRKLTDSPAIVSGNYGKGRVLLFSPHCERAPGPRSAFVNAIHWAAKSKDSPRSDRGS
ncbi:BPL-N domain-containing protein [Gimesia aquarii]|uniref:Biotin-protein ligase N-terminal domain-containing protein n=1 Tax=Gimesia aquarii TaxID=2527964 RepID=A0A517VX84_9PLAN|nr:BPL-N domain-containing protein [Gimesia aquarii]QDT97612.1 hypothetical protein V144x_30910 [Gimesia aquarii]